MNTNTYIQQEIQENTGDKCDAPKKGYIFREPEVNYLEKEPAFIDREEEEVAGMTKSQQKRYYKEIGVYK